MGAANTTAAPAELRRGPPAPRIAWVNLSELTPPRCSDILIGNTLAQYDDDNGPVFIVRVYADGTMRTADGYMFAPHDGLLWSPLPALPSAADPLAFELIADQIAAATAPADPAPAPINARIAAPVHWAMPCYPGSPKLPPVICRSYTGRPAAGCKAKDIRDGFHIADAFAGQLDAPPVIPAGSHCAPKITVNGLPAIERPSSIYPAEVGRES